MSKIKDIKAREILSSGGAPSIEVIVYTDNAVGKASFMFGASAGMHEAFVLWDDDPNRYLGRGMLKAVNHIKQEIAPMLIGRESTDQEAIDTAMIELDGTENKSRLGSNAILTTSMATAHASANSLGIPLYKYIRKIYNLPYKEYKLPKPMMVVLEGGRHADDSTDFQEYMVSPFGIEPIRESVRAGIEVYLTVKKVLKERGYNTNVGNEGAYAPSGLKDNEEPLEIITGAIERSGYKPGREVAISLDPAASEIYKDGFYSLSKEDKRLTSQQLIDYLSAWIDRYPILTLEDGLAEDDWEFWPILTERLGERVRIVGDDLITTNIERLKKAVQLKAVNAVLIKLNQIGTLTETVQAIEYTHQNSFISIVSHRGGGETNDVTMIDLAVATNSGFVKVGPSRGERVVKYNRLMEIEAEVVDEEI